MAVWGNWQTRMSKKHIPQGVSVRLRPWSQIIKAELVCSAFFMYLCNMEDNEKIWAKIEADSKNLKEVKSIPKETCHYKIKYNELNERYRSEFSRNTGSIDCEELLDDLYAFERVFRIMKK